MSIKMYFDCLSLIGFAHDYDDRRKAAPTFWFLQYKESLEKLESQV